MYDIVTFGSACVDVFIKLESVKLQRNKELISGKGLCFNSGSKIDVDSVYFFPGGGGTNSAATFALQGFKTAFAGGIGDDIAGGQVIEDLKKRKIDTGLVFKTDKKPTNYSVVLKVEKADRTILVYRGASELIDKDKIAFNKIKKAKWFYLAPLSGRAAKTTKCIVDFAKKNRIKVALNPGNSQLSLPKKELGDIINKVDILLLNQEEASVLTGIDYSKEKEIFKKIDDICPGIAIMTKGGDGVTVSDGKHLFSAPGEKKNIVDNTGAGDAFGSGFVSGFIMKKDIEYAIQLAMANSVSCLTKLGAKGGLLEKRGKFKKIKTIKEACLGHNCKQK
jgi:sugar/nucleoside kinase (ribokinase family)